MEFYDKFGAYPPRGQPWTCSSFIQLLGLSQWCKMEKFRFRKNDSLRQNQPLFLYQNLPVSRFLFLLPYLVLYFPRSCYTMYCPNFKYASNVGIWQSGKAPGGQAQEAAYAITQEDHIKYHKLFITYDTDHDGFVEILFKIRICANFSTRTPLYTFYPCCCPGLCRVVRRLQCSASLDFPLTFFEQFGKAWIMSAQYTPIMKSYLSRSILQALFMLHCLLYLVIHFFMLPIPIIFQLFSFSDHVLTMSR